MSGDAEMGSLFFVRRLRRYTQITGGGIGDAENRAGLIQRARCAPHSPLRVFSPFPTPFPSTLSPPGLAAIFEEYRRLACFFPPRGYFGCHRLKATPTGRGVVEEKSRIGLDFAAIHS